MQKIAKEHIICTLWLFLCPFVVLFVSFYELIGAFCDNSAGSVMNMFVGMFVRCHFCCASFTSSIFVLRSFTT